MYISYEYKYFCEACHDTIQDPAWGLDEFEEAATQQISRLIKAKHFSLVF